MNQLLILGVILVMVVIFTNFPCIRETFTSFQLINTYTNVKDARKGVVADTEYFFAINTTSISKYDIRTGIHLKSINFEDHPRIRNLTGGVIVNNRLYVANAPETDKHRQNTIEVFTKDLVYLYNINVTGNTGSLTWIDYYDGKWWGCFAHFNDQVRYTAMVEFYHPNPNLEIIPHQKDLVNWHVKDRWFFPHKVSECFKPYSCMGGSFGPDGKLYVTGNNKNELYVLNFNQYSPIMALDHTKNVDIEGKGICWDRERGLLYGTGRNESVFIYQI